MAQDSRLGAGTSPLNFGTHSQLLTRSHASRGDGVKWRGGVERNTEHSFWKSSVPPFLVGFHLNPRSRGNAHKSQICLTELA